MPFSTLDLTHNVAINDDTNAVCGVFERIAVKEGDIGVLANGQAADPLFDSE